MSECLFQENRLLEVLLLSELTLYGPFPRNKDITAKQISYDLNKATNMPQVLQLEAPSPPRTTDSKCTFRISFLRLYTHNIPSVMNQFSSSGSIITKKRYLRGNPERNQYHTPFGSLLSQCIEVLIDVPSPLIWRQLPSSLCPRQV